EAVEIEAKFERERLCRERLAGTARALGEHPNAGIELHVHRLRKALAAAAAELEQLELAPRLLRDREPLPAARRGDRRPHCFEQAALQRALRRLHGRRRNGGPAGERRRGTRERGGSPDVAARHPVRRYELVDRCLHAERGVPVALAKAGVWELERQRDAAFD